MQFFKMIARNPLEKGSKSLVLVELRIMKMEFTLDHSNYGRCELNSRNKKKNPMLTKSKLMNFLKNMP